MVTTDARFQQEPHHRLLIHLPDSFPVLRPLHFPHRPAENSHALGRIEDRKPLVDVGVIVRSAVTPILIKIRGIAVPSQRRSLSITEFISSFRVVRIEPALRML